MIFLLEWQAIMWYIIHSAPPTGSPCFTVLIYSTDCRSASLTKWYINIQLTIKTAVVVLRSACICFYEHTLNRSAFHAEENTGVFIRVGWLVQSIPVGLDETDPSRNLCCLCVPQCTWPGRTAGRLLLQSDCKTEPGYRSTFPPPSPPSHPEALWNCQWCDGGSRDDWRSVPCTKGQPEI